jgi:tetratricopeptide (TPR) repeat protein
MPRPSSTRTRSEPRPRRRPGRRSPPPPALLQSPGEKLEGARVLDELPGEAGVLLWQALRDVTLWASLPPEGREGLFRPGAAAARLALLVEVGVDAALHAPLATFAALVGEPAEARGETVTLAAMQTARWAEARGALGTALAFTQAAALVSPADAVPALETGYLARRVGEEARAESWFRRAIGQGRRSGDRLSWCRACLALGEVYARRGQAAPARTLFLRALRGGKRRGYREVAAEALRALQAEV